MKNGFIVEYNAFFIDMILLIQKDKKGHVMPRADNNCSVWNSKNGYMYNKHAVEKKTRERTSATCKCFFLIEYYYSLSSGSNLRLEPAYWKKMLSNESIIYILTLYLTQKLSIVFSGFSTVSYTSKNRTCRYSQIVSLYVMKYRMN